MSTKSAEVVIEVAEEWEPLSMNLKKWIDRSKYCSNTGRRQEVEPVNDVLDEEAVHYMFEINSPLKVMPKNIAQQTDTRIAETRNMQK